MNIIKISNLSFLYRVFMKKARVNYLFLGTEGDFIKQFQNVLEIDKARNSFLLQDEKLYHGCYSDSKFVLSSTSQFGNTKTPLFQIEGWIEEIDEKRCEIQVFYSIKDIDKIFLALITIPFLLMVYGIKNNSVMSVFLSLLSYFAIDFSTYLMLMYGKRKSHRTVEELLGLCPR